MERKAPQMSALEKRLIGRLLPALLVALLAASAVSFWLTHEKMLQTRQYYGEQLVSHAATALAKVDPNEDNGAATAIMNDLRNVPAVSSVRLLDLANGQKFAQDSNHSPGLRFDRKVQPLQNARTIPAELHLEITLVPPSVGDVFREVSGQLCLLILLAITFGLLGMFVFRRLVVQPLQVFHHGVDAHKPGEPMGHWEKSPPPDELGGVMRAYELISRHHQDAVKKLIVSQDRLRILSDNLPNAFLYQNRVEPNGEVSFTFVGESVRQMLGVAPEDAYRDPGVLRSKVDPDYAVEMGKVEEKAIRMRSEFIYECPYLFPDGKRHWVQFLSRPSQMPDGEYLWQGIFVDVSEAREKDAELQRSRADARAILDALPDPVFVQPFPSWKENACFTHVNQSAGEFLGMTEKELLATGPGRVDEITPEEVHRIRAGLMENKRFRFETTFIHKDGHRFPGELCSTIIEFAGKTVAVSVARSLVEQKRHEAELKDAVTQIDADRALIAQKNTELSQLIHILCHDLANPIFALNGKLQLRQSAPQLSPKEWSELLQISQQVLKLIGLVHRLQGIEEGKLTLALEPVDLTPVLAQALGMVQGLLEEKQIRVHSEVEGSLQVQVEPISFLNSVLANLLTNAIKFSNRGSEIQITAKAQRDQAILEIRDSGIGIPSTLLNQIFDPLAKTTRPGTAGEMGTGFGLPLVKKIVELYHGTIEITSVPMDEKNLAAPSSSGTTVRLTLPLTMA